VRIGVWMPPDPAANSYGGAAIRKLIYPSLFRATPDGTWEPSLVRSGTDKTDPGATSARFALRAAKWSDGTPITVSDLRRTLDARFVASIDDPTPTGVIVVHFTQALPGWRRLWSGLEPITPPHDGLSGGPYKVGAVTKDLETILVANPDYFGTPPHITEVHFVLVPDPEIAARLMDRGELDVVAPPAYTDRMARLARIKDAHVITSDKGGWTAAFVANPSRLNLDERLFLLAYANGPRFTDVLLHGEASSLAPAVSTNAKPAFPGTPAFTVPDESAPSNVLLHAMQRKAHKAGFDFDLRQAEFDEVLGAYATGDFDVVFRLQPTPATVCWTCQDATVDAALAKRADAGDRAAMTSLQNTLVSQGYELPLWRERSAAAVRDGLAGVSLNGFDVDGPAWDLPAWRWD
jgi:ABC-type oligopeptide transport system substrate-binding subunit